MKKVEIKKQVVIGWAVVHCPCETKPGKVVELIVSVVGRTGDDKFEEEHSYFGEDITRMLPAAPGTYRITTFVKGDVVILGISHPGDGLNDAYWLAAAEERLTDEAMSEARAILAERSTIAERASQAEYAMSAGRVTQQE
jgi:hypothetical protein